MRVPQQDIINVLQEIESTWSGCYWDEATALIQKLRCLGRNPDFCNSFSDVSLSHLIRLTDPYPSWSSEDRLAQLPNSVSIIATISNVLLLNRKLHQTFTAREDLFENTLDIIRYSTSNYTSYPSDLGLMVPPTRLIFLVLYNGLTLKDVIIKDCIDFFQFSLPRVNQHAIEFGVPITQMDPDGAALCRESWKCCFTFLNYYKKYTESFVQHIPMIIEAFNTIASQNDFNTETIPLLKTCSQLILCFHTKYFEVDKDTFESYKSFFSLMLRLVKAEIEDYEINRGTVTEPSDILSAFYTLIHLADITDYELLEPKSVSDTNIDEQLRKLSISSSIYNEKDKKDSRRSSMTCDSSIFDTSPPPLVSPPSTKSQSSSFPNLTLKENSAIYDKIQSKNKLRSILTLNFLPKQINEKRFQNPWYYDKSLQLLNSPELGSLKAVIILLMYKLSVPENKVPNTEEHLTSFLKLVGYLNASGFIFTNSIKIPQSIDLDAYLYPQYDKEKSHSRHNSINDLPDMTDEEKEIEAEKLFTLFERIKKNGVLNVENPVAQWQREGKFEDLD